jgi:exodeoxyribonuclease V alpha subunit
VVLFTVRAVTYDYADLSELVLVCVVFLYKLQVGEYPAVIFPTIMQHYPLHNRSLLYTEQTRAKQLAVLVDLTKAIGLDIKRKTDQQQ